MNTTLTIKNFRVFDENGVDVKLAPLTILTGCNSSGKSTIVKSILLLDSFLKQIKRDHENGNPIRLDAYKLDFGTYPNNLLGRYDKVVNRRSEDKRITFAYTVHSLMLSKDLTVELVFSADKSDELNNGYLESLTISCEEGIIYFSGKNPKGCTCNLNLIKEAAVDFILAEHLVRNYFSLYVGDGIDNGISRQDVKEQKGDSREFVEQIGKDRFRDVLRQLRGTDRKETIVKELKFEPQVLEWTKEHGSFFYIPLVEALKDDTKETIKARIAGEILAGKTLSISLQDALDKVIADFAGSGCTTFGEYFQQKEDSFLEEAVKGHLSTYELENFWRSEIYPRVFEIYPSVLGKRKLAIQQQHIYNDPRNYFESVAVFSGLENGKLIVRAPTPQEVSSQKEGALNAWRNTPVNFALLYEVLMNVNKVYTDDRKNPYYEHFEYLNGINGFYCHHAFGALNLFAHYLVMECLLPAWSGNISYVSSSRGDVKRLYPLDGADDFTQLLQRYFEGKRLQKAEDHNEAAFGPFKRKDYRLNHFTAQCLKAFGIGESIIFKVDEDGLGVKLFLHRADGSGDSLLADEGYGITQLVSILLQIETVIVTAKGEPTGHITGFDDPDKRDSLKFYYEPRVIAIEEPEIHLHPKFQSLLADMFAAAYEKYNIRFLIETHSEYLIRKMQVLVAEKRVEPDDVSLLYVNEADASRRAEGEPHVKEIGICKDGYLSDTFGTGFFDEATSLSRQLL